MNPEDDIPAETLQEMEDEYNERVWQEQITEKRKEIGEIPINLIIDTNWWIYLTKEENFPQLRQIAEKLNTGEFRILVPEQIIIEWDRNLEQTKNSAIASIKNQTKNSLKISNHLEEPNKSEFIRILNEYKVKELKRIRGIETTIGTIDEIIKSKSKIITVSQTTKDLVIKHGLHRMAPFKTKNSTADAIIFFSAIEYLEQNSTAEFSNSIFVSYNSDDFSKSKSEQDIIHPDLADFLTDTNTKYERNIAKALKLSEDLQGQIDDYLHERAAWALEEEYIESQIEDYIQHMIDVRKGK